MNKMTDTKNTYMICPYIKLTGEVCNSRCLSIYGGFCHRHRNAKPANLCSNCNKRGTRSIHNLCSSKEDGCYFKRMYINKISNKTKNILIDIPSDSSPAVI